MNDVLKLNRPASKTPLTEEINNLKLGQVTMKINLKRYLMYLARWQLSTPILAVVLIWFSKLGKWKATIIANLIGGLIFYWIDLFIFRSSLLSAQWEITENIICFDCGATTRGYRLVKTANYDKTKDPFPQFRCEKCSIEKTKLLKARGVLV